MHAVRTSGATRSPLVVEAGPELKKAVIDKWRGLLPEIARLNRRPRMYGERLLQRIACEGLPVHHVS